MLTKAANHLRPFIRVPSQPLSTPEHFSANPSLLHHLPQNGVSHSLITQSSTSASSSSSSTSGPGAGRNGYSAGNSGYTGHARAFLSFQHGAGIDGSSVVNGLDEEKNQKKIHGKGLDRYPSRQVKLVIIPEGEGRKVRKELEGRQGTRLNIIENKTRRSSITFPRSEVAVWQVGISRPNRQLRHLSTSIVQRIPAPETRVLSQPNRVIMDLAGHSEPILKVGGVRRNSVSTMERVPEVLDPLLINSDRPQADRDIQHSINKAAKARDVQHVKALVDHYRSPRTLSPFDETKNMLSSSHPLPSGYTIDTYNTCLAALLSIRQQGEAIVQILDIYNEMLSRDIIPNVKTYSSVIKALCLREMDIGAAVRLHQRDQRWEEWGNSNTGTKAQTQAEDVLGYLREGNLSSAFKLFRAAVLFLPRGASFSPETFDTLLEASAASPSPDLEGSFEVFRYATTKSAPGYLSLYAPMIETLGKAKDHTKLTEIWNEFVSLPKNDVSHWVVDGKATVPQSNYRKTWQYAVVAFVRSGDIPKAIELMEQMASSEHSKTTLETNIPPRANHLIIGELVVALARAGEFDLAMEWYNRSKVYKSDMPGNHIPQAAHNQIIDELVLKHQVGYALEIVPHALKIVDLGGERCGRVYQALLAEPSEKTLAALDTLIPFIKVGDSSQPVFEHVRLLLKAGRVDDIVGLLSSIEFTSDETIPDDIASHPLTLVQRLEITRAFYRHHIHVSTETALAIFDQYTTERSKVSSPLELNIDPLLWYRLSSFVATSAGALKVEMTTEPFIQFIQDIITVSAAHPGLELSNLSDSFSNFFDRLSSRFGRDVALEIMEPVGEIPGITRLASKVSSIRPTSEFSFPPTPESLPATPATTSYSISGELSSKIDQMFGKFPTVTLSQAYDLIQSHLPNNQIPHAETLSRVIVAFSRNNDEPKVQEIYSLACTAIQSTPEVHQPLAWAHVENGMLVACCHLGHLEQAGMHRARLVENGMAPSADAYASMIANSKDTTDDALVARELFAESQALGVRPTLYLYNTIISKLSKARKAESALELFVQMKAAGCRPSSVTYGAVINACCRVGDAESAATLFDEMCSMPNFKPRVPPFNTMMQFHLQTRPSREHVLHYYNALRQANVPPSAHTYKLLLDTYSVLPPIDLEQMERVFADLCADRSVPVQGTHWASLITAYGIHGDDLPKAIEIFNSIPSHPSTRPGYQPEPVVWEAILNVIAQKGTISELESIQQRMIDSGSHATAYVYNVLISAYSSAQIEKSREIFESMADSIVGVAAPNNHPTLLTSSGQVKPSTVTAQPTHVVYREPSTYEAMIRAELVGGDRSRAELVLRRMEERRYPVAVFMRARAILDEPLDV